MPNKIGGREWIEARCFYTLLCSDMGCCLTIAPGIVADLLSQLFFFSSRRRHTRYWRDWSSDVCSSDLEAEQIAAESTAWKAAGDRLKAIVEEWKTIRGIDRKTDEALWQRFAAARDSFGRRRGAHFAALDAQRGEARAAKQELIAEAQRLSASTEWGPTSAAMRSLMDRWKAVPRTGRDGDDDLWKQFRAAQDVFFAARSESDKARTSEELANQQAKEEILAEAEKLDPAKRSEERRVGKECRSRW